MCTPTPTHPHVYIHTHLSTCVHPHPPIHMGTPTPTRPHVYAHTHTSTCVHPHPPVHMGTPTPTHPHSMLYLSMVKHPAAHYEFSFMWLYARTTEISYKVTDVSVMFLQACTELVLLNTAQHCYMWLQYPVHITVYTWLISPQHNMRISETWPCECRGVGVMQSIPVL
jgi:hypothetical protein